MKIRPYYLIQAWSKRANKLQTQFLQNEMAANDRCTNIKAAHQRSIAFAASLRESKLANATDWEPRVRLINDSGSHLLDSKAIIESIRR
jgi:hypothetical protein